MYSDNLTQYGTIANFASNCGSQAKTRNGQMRAIKRHLQRMRQLDCPSLSRPRFNYAESVQRGWKIPPYNRTSREQYYQSHHDRRYRRRAALAVDIAERF